jgi:nitric oxide reductase NorD protein
VSDEPEENTLLYVVRVVLGAEIAARGAPGADEAEVLQAVTRLRASFDGFGPAWERARALEGETSLSDSCLWGPVFSTPTDPGAAGADAEPDGGVASDATEMEAPPIEEITVHRMGEEPLELPVHAFEKVEMAESFAGTFRRPDGSDELDQHLEALQEVQLGHLLRGGPSVGSLMKADIAIGADVPDVGTIEAHEPFVAYPEWDRRRTAYRPDWCRVYPTPMPRGDEAWARDALARHRHTVERMHGQLLRHRDRLRPQPRQLDGEDVDIEALCDAWATLHAGRTPSQRLYVRQARVQRDLATTVLLDVSLSTDSWVANRRVLDVAKESVLVLGEVAD